MILSVQYLDTETGLCVYEDNPAAPSHTLIVSQNPPPKNPDFFSRIKKVAANYTATLNGFPHPAQRPTRVSSGHMLWQK
jgi:hypothetical protein